MTIKEIKKIVPGYVLSVAQTLLSKGYEAYLVGGSIRDILINRTPIDFDIATNADPENVEKIFPKSIPTGAKFGTITVIAQDLEGERHDVQVTTYRSEADYFGGRWPAKVSYAKTIEEDLGRRDFTINAIALDLKQLIEESDASKEIELKDPFNGVADLEKKVIKAVGDPMQRLSEDGLRAVRACRLASQLEFKIEEKTFEAIKQTNHITKLVSIERFRDELMKLLLKSPKPSVGLQLLKDSGILKLFIPELLEGVGVVQPEFHSDDVFTHSILTVDYAEDSIKLAALFHDIGKPFTKTEDEKGIHFYSHDVKGAEMTKEIMKRLKFPNSEIERTEKLVRWHMFFYPSASWRANEDKDEEAKAPHGWTDGAIRRLIKNVGEENAIDDLLKLRIADQSSNKKYEFNQEELDAFAERVANVRAKEMALKISDLAISGLDIKKYFNLEEGPKIGEMLNYLLEEVIEDPLKNKKETLLQLLKEKFF